MVSFVFRDVWLLIRKMAIWILSRKMMKMIAALCPINKKHIHSFNHSHNLVKDDIMEVMLVVVGMLAPVNRSKLKNTVAVVGVGVGVGAGVGLDWRSSLGRRTSVGADGGFLRVWRRCGRSEREEGWLGRRSEREEVLRRKVRHFGRVELSRVE
jgi:hypothetical protein